MRVDIREPEQKGKTYHVFLNGEEISHKCFLADSAKGYVECFVLDKHGKPTYNAELDAANTQRLHGDVMIYEDISIEEIVRRGTKLGGE